ncbi:MAG: metal ABC transporter ATP-binding protein [Nitrospirota bacterium]
MSIDVVRVENLTFRYNSLEVLNDISFGIQAGDYVGLVGPNGSGKTTLIKAILGLIRPDSGKISIFGRNISEFGEWHRIGYLPQRLLLNPYFPATVKEIVSLGLFSKKSFPKRLKKSDEAAINYALKLMDVSDIKDTLIGELSGGQQQRVLGARALVNEPELLILDEPTTALDPEAREHFYHFLRELNQERNVTIILVTHDSATIGKYASKLLYIDKRIIFFGSFQDFCISDNMTNYFGEFAQHLICHRHD